MRSDPETDQEIDSEIEVDEEVDVDMSAIIKSQLERGEQGENNRIDSYNRKGLHGPIDFLTKLPSEISLQILLFLSTPKDLVLISQVSKRWFLLSRDNFVWKALFERMGWKMRKDLKGFINYRNRIKSQAKDKRKRKAKAKGKGKNLHLHLHQDAKADSDSDLDSELNYFNLFAKKFVLEKRWNGWDYPLDGIRALDSNLGRRTRRRRLSSFRSSWFRDRDGDEEDGDDDDDSNGDDDEEEEEEYEYEYENENGSSQGDSSVEENESENENEHQVQEASSAEEEGDEDDDEDPAPQVEVEGTNHEEIRRKIRETIKSTEELRARLALFEKGSKPTIKKFRPTSYFLKGHTDSIYCLGFDNGNYQAFHSHPSNHTHSISNANNDANLNLNLSNHHCYPKLISGSRDHSLKIWNLEDLKCKYTLKGHKGSVLCLKYDDEILVAGSSDKTVSVWDFSIFDPTKRPVGNAEGKAEGASATMDRDKRGETPQVPQSIKNGDGDGGGGGGDGDGDGGGDGGGDMEEENQETKPRILSRLSYHKEGVLDVAFNQDYIVSCSKDFQVCVWSRNKGGNGHDVDVDLPSTSRRRKSKDSHHFQEEEQEEGEGEGNLSILSKQTKSKDLKASKILHFNSSDSYTTSFWRDSNSHASEPQGRGRPITLNYVYSTHSGPVNAISLSQNCVISASGDNFMYLWSLRTGENKIEFKGHERGLACTDFNHGKLVTGSNDRLVKVWKSDGECLANLESHTELVRAVKADFKNGRIVSAGYDRKVCVWNLDENLGQANNEHERNHLAEIATSRADSDEQEEVSEEEFQNDQAQEQEQEQEQEPNTQNVEMKWDPSPKHPVLISKPCLDLRSKAYRVFDVEFDSRKIFCCGDDFRIEIKDFSLGLGEDVDLFK